VCLIQTDPPLREYISGRTRKRPLRGAALPRIPLARVPQQSRIRVTEPCGKGSERIGGVEEGAKVGIDLGREINEHFDVVSAFERFPVVNEEGLHRLLGSLLAVINGNVVKGRFARGDAARGFQIAPRF